MLTQCSHDENFAFLGKQDQGEAVVLANPKTAEYQVVRTSLLPGLLKTLGSNTHHALPLQIFEVSDVVLQDPKSDVYARNERHVGCLYNAKTSGFELVHGLVDRLMLMLDVPSGPTGYSISPLDCKTYFPGRCAAINYKGTVVGQFGILHPDVTDAFGITGVCSALEFNLEAFL